MAGVKSIIDTLIAEALGEGPEGMRLVGETILNRSRERGLTPEQVVRQPRQYTGYSNPGPAVKKAQENPALRAIAEAAWKEAQKPGDPTGGANHYFNPNLVSPSWAQSMTPTITSGNHAFYRDRPASPAAQAAPTPASASDLTNLRQSYVDSLPSLPRARPETARDFLRSAAMDTPDVNTLYEGILPSETQPERAVYLTRPGAIADTMQVAQDAQNPALAAALQSRIAGDQIASAASGQAVPVAPEPVQQVAPQQVSPVEPVPASVFAQYYAPEPAGIDDRLMARMPAYPETTAFAAAPSTPSELAPQASTLQAPEASPLLAQEAALRGRTPAAVPERLAPSAPGLGDFEGLSAYAVSNLGTGVSPEVNASGLRVAEAPPNRAASGGTVPTPAPAPATRVASEMDTIPASPAASSIFADALAPSPAARMQRPGIFGNTQLPGAIGMFNDFTQRVANASGPFSNNFDNALFNTMRGGNPYAPGSATHKTASGFLYRQNGDGSYTQVGRDRPAGGGGLSVLSSVQEALAEAERQTGREHTFIGRI